MHSHPRGQNENLVFLILEKICQLVMRMMKKMMMSPLSIIVMMSINSHHQHLLLPLSRQPRSKSSSTRKNSDHCQPIFVRREKEEAGSEESEKEGRCEPEGEKNITIHPPVSQELLESRVFCSFLVFLLCFSLSFLFLLHACLCVDFASLCSLSFLSISAPPLSTFCDGLISLQHKEVEQQQLSNALYR